MMEGTKVPSFIGKKYRLIVKEEIEQLVLEALEETDLFLVDIKVSTSNQINVLIDRNEGIGINDCVRISRHVESNLDREKEDFELQVSSPGLSEPFKVLKQYEKHLGKEVKVLTFDGRKHEGFLKEFDEEKVVITYQVKERIEGRKKKELVEKMETYFFENEDNKLKIKETKVVISFK